MNHRPKAKSAEALGFRRIEDRMKRRPGTRPDVAEWNRRRATHGAARGNRPTPTYLSWRAMLSRSRSGTNPKDRRRYLDQGITVTERWTNFATFLADMGERPPGTTLDRIDNMQGYTPENCRWATPTQQNRNRRSNVRLTFRGQTKTPAEWAEIVGIERHTIGHRIRNGWPIEDALTIKPDKRNRLGGQS